MKVLQFVNGVYQGHVNESNQLNGLGVFYWKNSQIYYGMHSFFFQQIQGCWKQNVMHGRGIVVLPQGGYVYGYFKNNLLDGKFKLVFPNQDTIFGSSSQGLFQGTAIRKFKESYQYIQCQYEKGNMISISCKITKEQFKETAKIEFTELVNMKEFFQQDKNSQTVTKEYYNIYDKFNNQMKCLEINEQEIYLGSTKINFPRGYGVKINLKSNLIQRGKFIDGMLDGRGRKNFLNGDIYDGGFTQGQISNCGLFYDNSKFTCYRGYFEYNKLVTLFAIFTTKFPPSQSDYEKQEKKEIECNQEIQSECVFFTEKEALFMINSFHYLGKKQNNENEIEDQVQKNFELIELTNWKNNLYQYASTSNLIQSQLKSNNKITDIAQIQSYKSKEDINEKIDQNTQQQTVNYKKSVKNFLPPLSRKASLQDAQIGYSQGAQSSVLNSTQPFSSQYNSNTSSNNTFIQQLQVEYQSNESNSQQSSYFSKYKSQQQANLDNNQKQASNQNIIKKVSFSDVMKEFNYDKNKTTDLKIPNMMKEQILQKTEDQIQGNDKNSSDQQNEEIIYEKSQNDEIEKTNNEEHDYKINYYSNENNNNNSNQSSQNKNCQDISKENQEMQSIIIEKSIELSDQDQDIQTVNSFQNKPQNFENYNQQIDILNKDLNDLQNSDLNQQYLFDCMQKRENIQDDGYYDDLSLHSSSQHQNESCIFYDQGYLESYNQQEENQIFQENSFHLTESQCKQQQDDYKNKINQRESLLNLQAEEIQMNYIYNHDYQTKEVQKQNKTQIDFYNSLNSHNSESCISEDEITQSVQFQDYVSYSKENVNKSGFQEYEQNQINENVLFQQYFQMLQSDQNIQQINDQLTLTFSKNNDSSNWCIDQKQKRDTLDKNDQSNKQISQNFLVGINSDSKHPIINQKEQKQATKSDFSAKLKQIVQPNQYQYNNLKQQDLHKKHDQKSLVSDNQIVDSNMTTEQSYQNNHFKIKHKNNQFKSQFSNITYENRISFSQNTQFQDNLLLSHQQNQFNQNYCESSQENQIPYSQISGKNYQQLDIKESFENKENQTPHNKFKKIQHDRQSSKANKQQQQQSVKVVSINLLQELSQNQLNNNSDKYEPHHNNYSPQIFDNQVKQSKLEDQFEEFNPQQFLNNQMQVIKNNKQTSYYKSQHKKQKSEILLKQFEESEYCQNQMYRNSNQKLSRKQSTGSLNLNHSNQIQKMVSSKSYTLLKQISFGDLLSKNCSEEISTKILKQISSKQFQGQKPIFQKLIEFKNQKKNNQLS